ncbi:caspase family protein [Nannocystaceae bacterium ST9]
MPAEEVPRFRVLLIGIRSDDFDTVEAIDLVEGMVRRLNPAALIQRRFGRLEGTRDAILHALDAWIADTRADDTCLVYYFGHGGRVRFVNLGDGLACQVIPYLTCERQHGGFTGILDFELSGRITELDRRCGNVTTIIDACYSGVAVRGEESRAVGRRSVVDMEAPCWVPALFAKPESRLAADSHPRVVRLAGTSPRQQAFLTSSAEQASLRQGPRIGMFTRALLDALAAVGDDWAHMSWDCLAHAVRQRVIAAFRMEGQWIALAGPRERLLFSTRHAQPSWAVACVEAESGLWIRAGEIQGVEVGDRWAILDPRVDRDARPVALVEADVTEVGLNLARLSASMPSSSPAPVTAHPVAVRRRMPVDVESPIDLELNGSAWLELGGAKSPARVQRVDGELEVVAARSDWARMQVPDDAAGRVRVLELLEDWARLRRLREAWSRPSSESPLTWVVGRGEIELAANVTLRCADQVWIRLQNSATSNSHWFVSVILVDVLGRACLLNASQPDGVELEPDDFEYVGRRLGATSIGFTLDWPVGASRDCVGHIELLILASDRPIQLGHLVRVAPSSEIAAFRLQSLGPTHRGRSPAQTQREPVRATRWVWASIGFDLLPPEPGA